MGSFQDGRLFRSGDPRNTAWRQVERIGTVDSLIRIAQAMSIDTEKARVASLRIRQALELRSAAGGTSPLTRPLLHYYSALNLVRGVMLTYLGDIGGASHGLRYQAGTDLLSCSATLCKSGSFPRFAGFLQFPIENHSTGKFTLRDIFAVIPELRNDFSLLQVGSSSVALVRVHSFIHGDLKLRYYIQDEDENDFQQNWRLKLPWFAEECELDEPFTLKVANPPDDDGAISAYLHKRLLNDLEWRDDAVWYDHVVRPDIVLFPRLLAYLLGLFILSNVSRYEPEFIGLVTRDPTDHAYVLTSFLDHAERYLPQMLLSLLMRTQVYFT